MNHHLLLVKSLSSDAEKEKLASDIEELSISELGHLLKTAGIEYCDACDRVKEKCVCEEKKSSVEWADARGRELAKEAFSPANMLGQGIRGVRNLGSSVARTAKSTGSAIKSAPGGIANTFKKDWAATKAQFQAGKQGLKAPAPAPHPMASPTAAAKPHPLAVPEGLPKEVPVSTGTHPMAAPASAPVSEASLVSSGKHPLAPAEAAPNPAPAAKPAVAAGRKTYRLTPLSKGLIGGAVGTGGVMAASSMMNGGQQKTSSVEKVAVGLVGKIDVKELAKTIGRNAGNSVKGVAQRINTIHDPAARGAVIGGVTGGIGGAVQGFLDPKEDPMTGKKQRLRTAIRKGVAATAAGIPTGALFGAMQKSGSVRKLEAALEKNAVGIGLPSLGGLAKTVANSSFARNLAGGVKGSVGQMAGAGAAVGGGLGALKGAIAPGYDSHGNQKSRLGGALAGGLKGGAFGATSGVAAKMGLSKLQKLHKMTPSAV